MNRRVKVLVAKSHRALVHVRSDEMETMTTDLACEIIKLCLRGFFSASRLLLAIRVAMALTRTIGYF